LGSVRTYLVIDIGTSAVKAACIGQDGRALGSATIEYPLHMLQAGRVECDPETYWQAVVGTTRLARRAAEAEHGQVDIEAMAVTSQAETLLCLDARGSPLRAAIVWLDNRSGAESVELGEHLGIRTIHASTGQMLSLPTSPASKILWLARHEPAVFRATATFCLVGDWITRRLAGALVGDITAYPTSLLVDIGRRQWWPPMLELLDLTPDRLVTLVSPATVIGKLTRAAARELDLDALPLVSGAMDTISGAVGAGNLAPGLLTEATGTYLAPLICIDTRPPFMDPGFPVLLHAVPDMYCALPYGQTAGALLRWLYDILMPATSKTAPERDYTSLISEAAQVSPGADGLTFLPHLAGAGFPEWDLAATGTMTGIRLGHGRGHIVRAGLESVAFMLRGAIEGLRETGAQIEAVTSLGPASRSLPWLQIKADVCQLPVARLEQDEASLLGAAMLAAVARGDYTDLQAAASAMTRVADTVEPNPNLRQTYDDAYARYRSLNRNLRAFNPPAPT
jgi:sugar (pentulose or hexulose) kinase